MKITIVNFAPFHNNAQAPELPPDQMAAAAARFSRNNQGLDAILQKVQHVPMEKRADAILRMADYGHKSILDLLEIPITLEGISMYAAARLFQFAKLGAGQESSTRYINEGFNILSWQDTDGFNGGQYIKAEEMFEKWYSNVSSIPENATREERNSVLDKVRYDLPIIATTNVFLTQSAGAWRETLQKLRSYPHEFQVTEIAMACAEIEIAIERVAGKYAIKHSGFNNAWYDKFSSERNDLSQWDTNNHVGIGLFIPLSSNHKRNNRYDPWDLSFDETIIRVSMPRQFAEVRDMNRHRNHQVKIWHFFELYDGTYTLGSRVKMYDTMSLSQFLYEVELRTSEGAHPSYKAQQNYLFDELCAQYRLRGYDLKKTVQDIGFFANQEKYAE